MDPTRAPAQNLPGTTWVHTNPWFSVGLLEGYYTIEPTNAQVAVVVSLGKDLILVRARRPLLGTSLLEVPAGGAEAGETPAAAIQRELYEETGILVPEARFQATGPLTVSPDRIPSWPHLFKVAISEEEFAGRLPHDDEVEEVVRLDRSTLLELVAQGGIRSCLTMAMLFRHCAGELGGIG